MAHGVRTFIWLLLKDYSPTVREWEFVEDSHKIHNALYATPLLKILIKLSNHVPLQRQYGRRFYQLICVLTFMARRLILGWLVACITLIWTPHRRLGISNVEAVGHQKPTLIYWWNFQHWHCISQVRARASHTLHSFAAFNFKALDVIFCPVPFRFFVQLSLFGENILFNDSDQQGLTVNSWDCRIHN